MPRTWNDLLISAKTPRWIEHASVAPAPHTRERRVQVLLLKSDVPPSTDRRVEVFVSKSEVGNRSESDRKSVSKTSKIVPKSSKIVPKRVEVGVGAELGEAMLDLTEVMSKNDPKRYQTSSAYESLLGPFWGHVGSFFVTFFTLFFDCRFASILGPKMAQKVAHN